MAPSRWRFEPLDGSHVTAGFTCGAEPSLDEYLKRFALTNHRKGTARAYVTALPGNGEVQAFYTLSSAELSADLLAEAERKGLPRIIPGTLLGRMAVHADYQGNKEEKLGYFTLMDAFARTLQGAETVGSYFLLVDPISLRARDFYVRAGFRDVPGKPERLLYPLSAIRKLGLPLPTEPSKPAGEAC